MQHIVHNAGEYCKSQVLFPWVHEYSLYSNSPWGLIFLFPLQLEDKVLNWQFSHPSALNKWSEHGEQQEQALS